MMLQFLIGVVALSSASAYTDVRLRGGSADWEGRVEVYHDGKWGTVCDDLWGIKEATVVCNQLGYPFATLADRSLRFGKGEGPIWMDDVMCDGDESSLEDCVRSDWGDHDCSHKEDAGVFCSEVQEGAVRLLGGSSRFEGRVEVVYRGNWGTVCDDLWSDNDARVVCRQLGYQKHKTAVTNAYRYFGYATTPYIIEDVRCDGFEDNLLDCVPFDDTPDGCSVYDVAGVFCHGSDTDDLSPEAIAGIVLGTLCCVGIILCCVAGIYSAKSKKKRATTSRNDIQADQMVYHVPAGGNATVTGFPQGYGQTGQYSPATPAAYMNPTAVDAPPAYSTVYEPSGPMAAATNAQGQTQPSGTQEHIYKEAL